MNINLAKHYILHYLTAKRKGHGVHSPFVYRLCEDVFYNSDGFYVFDKLNHIREQLLQNKNLLEIEDFGAGSKVFTSKQRRVCDIASKGISPAKQSELLFKLSNFLKCTYRVELGTSLGLNSLYLAAANKQGVVYSLEGSTQLIDFAKTLAATHAVDNIRFVQGHFDDRFPALLSELPALDLLYIDGNHTYEATLRYFTMALSKKQAHSVFVFDDIYWSPGMTKAWGEITQHPEVKLSIDCFQLGLVFFRDEFKEKQHLRLQMLF